MDIEFIIQGEYMEEDIKYLFDNYNHDDLIRVIDALLICKKLELDLIVGVSGPKRSGKTILAEVISYSLDYEKNSFANPIKRLCEYEYGDKENLRKNLYLPIGGLCRDYDEDFFVNYLENEIKFSLNDRFIIDDVRMENEAKICDLIIQLEGDFEGTETESPLPDEMIDFKIRKKD